MDKAEEKKEIEPYHQAQGKRLVDVLFDKGCFSDTLSRDGMDAIENLVAALFQQAATSAENCAVFAKNYKMPADQARHEEEMRWIARAREAEREVLKQRSEILVLQEAKERLESIFPREEKALEAWKWGREVGVFLKEALDRPYNWNAGEASRLFTDGIKLLIIPEPDCRPGKVWVERVEESEPYPPGVGGNALCEHSSARVPAPGQIIAVCPKCGGNKV